MKNCLGRKEEREGEGEGKVVLFYLFLKFNLILSRNFHAV